MTGIAHIKDEITRDNVHAMLRDIPCPHCGTAGKFVTFDVPNNNGVGLLCFSCQKKHPFMMSGLHWVPASSRPPRRRSNIVEVMLERGEYCYICGVDRETLARCGIGLVPHHTRPFAIYGDQYPQIPTCARCHHIITAQQTNMIFFVKPQHQRGAA